MESIISPNPDLAVYHKRWAKNRAFLSGRDAVIAGGELYLQKPTVRMGSTEYNSFKETVGFFPGALTVLAGWIGLIFRDEPDLIGPSELTDLEYVVTRDGDSLEEFSRAVVREVFTTNWCGVLTDYPTQSGNPSLTAANAIQEGVRPFLSFYPAESILDVQYGVRKNQRVVTHVRLLETQRKVLEYTLVDDALQVTTWTLDGGNWTAAYSIPVRDGQPLDRVPFQIITTNQSKIPTPSAFEHMVDINCDILNIEGLMAQASRYVANPIVAATNVAPNTNAEGEVIPREWSYGPGVVWELAGDAKVEIHENEGKGLSSLQGRLDEKKSQLARTGARILQDDKAAAEAVETVIVRQTSDNARLSSMTRSIQHQIEKSLITMAWWMGADESTVSFKLNTDYTEKAFSKELLDMIVIADQANYIDDKIIYHALTRPGGLIDPAVSYDLWASSREQRSLDMPNGLTFQAPTDGAE
jgi:hypothetical protein